MGALFSISSFIISLIYIEIFSLYLLSLRVFCFLFSFIERAIEKKQRAIMGVGWVQNQSFCVLNGKIAFLFYLTRTQFSMTNDYCYSHSSTALGSKGHRYINTQSNQQWSEKWLYGYVTLKHLKSFFKSFKWLLLSLV